tara:strand:+ start:578 stop:1888 length:1311 start_codon:yes stop_codon:yes gene_type:complete
MVLKNKNKKTIYVPIGADIIHAGHLNIINKARKYGKVIIGLLSDKAIAEYKRLPLNNYNQRLLIIKNLKNISRVIKQDTWDYEKNLLQLRPNYFIHGDDWKTGVQKKTRERVLKILKKIKGKLIEIPYTKEISSSKIINKLNIRLDKKESRVSLLKRLISAKDIVRLLESHNALTGIIIEKLKIHKKNKLLEFDGMWSSSLTDSATRGKPDNQAVDFSTRFSGLSEILDVTTKPVLFDADNGGRNEHISYTVRTLERLGVSGICIEDKIGSKKNSLFQNQTGSYQDSINNFSKKINIAKKSQITNDFFVVARIESFILGKSLKDAIKRANAYSASGADAILIHSKEKNPKQIFKFAKAFKKSKFYKPMIAVPSTYSKTYEKQLIKNGFKVVIYANQLLRAAYPQMLSTAKKILNNGRAYDAEKNISPINEVLNLIK